jgi:predicted dehydrogenase
MLTFHSFGAKTSNTYSSYCDRYDSKEEEETMKPVEVVVLGAGSRGFHAYGQWILAHSDQIRAVAVAEPDPVRRAKFAEAHNLSADRVFADHRALFAAGQLAQGLINATMDQQHVDTTLGALDAGYDVLLEKPMATTPHECVRLVRAAEAAGRMLSICHVMRYSPFYITLYETLCSGDVGEVMTVDHRENVAFWHQAHSFVRGNWGNSDRSAPMILAKSCHDMDVLFWLLGRRVKRLSSFGALRHFRSDQAPEGAPERCTDGCPHWERCLYYAPRIYLRDRRGWPINVITADLSYEGRMEALRTGPYGRCVYHCDNNVVDHMTINMLFEHDLTATFTMHAFSHENCRTMRFDGTKASLKGHGGKGELMLYDFRSMKERPIQLPEAKGGHGGGDQGVMSAFVKALNGKPSALHTTARDSLESHLMAFAAEESRLNGGVVIDMDRYRARIETEVAATE